MRNMVPGYYKVRRHVGETSDSGYLDHALAERVVTGRDKGVLHLHGFWRNPESLVFGAGSYERIRSDSHTQAILRAIRTLKTIVFVGCGYGGLSDPNLGRLLKSARVAFSQSQAEHFLLCPSAKPGKC